MHITPTVTGKAASTHAPSRSLASESKASEGRSSGHRLGPPPRDPSCLGTPALGLLYVGGNQARACGRGRGGLFIAIRWSALNVFTLRFVICVCV